MNTKKLNLSIGIIWGISLLIGFVYNALILPLTMQGAEYEYIVKFITYLICLTGSGLFSWWGANKMPQHGAGKMFILMYVPLLLASVFVHYTTVMDEIMGSTFVICIIYFLYSHCLSAFAERKHGLRKLLGLMILSTSAGYVTGGFSMYYLTLVVVFTTSVLAVFVYDVKNPKKWYIGFSLMAFILYFISPLFIILSKQSTELLFGYLAPKSSDIYAPIVKQLSNIELFRLDVLSDFAATLNYNGSSTYMHFTAMFGIVFAVIIIIAQIVGVYLMIKRAKLLKNKQNRIFGVMMSLIIGVQILLSIGSSFCGMPLNDSGAPFLTYKGLELSLIPLLLFILNIQNDSKNESFKSDELTVKPEKKEKKVFYNYFLEFLGLEEYEDKFEEWRR